MRKYSRARCAAIAVVCALAGGGPSWSAALCIVPLGGGDRQPVERFHRLDRGRWLIETKGPLYQLVEGGADLSLYEGSGFARITHLVPLARDISLILSNDDGSGRGGVFRAHTDSLKIQELTGSEALRFTAVARLSMGALVGTNRGLYRVDSTGAQFQETAGAETGRVSFLEQVDDNTWLVGAAFGVFRHDGRSARTERLSADTGDITHFERLNDGGWVVGTDKGLFRIDAAGRHVSAVPWKKAMRVAEIQKLADGAWLIRGEQGLLLADAPAKRLESLDEEGASSWRIQHNDQRGAILQNRRITYVLPAGAKKLEFITGEPLSEIHAVRPVQDGWLIAARRGLYRLDIARRQLTPLRGPALGRIASLHGLNTGAHLVAAEAGLFRTDVALQAWEPVPGTSPGRIAFIVPLEKGDFLVGAQRGLFRAGGAGDGLTPLAGAKMTDVVAAERLAKGDWLIRTRSGLGHVDAAATAALSVSGGELIDAGAVLQLLPDGRTLLGTARGLLVIAGMQEAVVSFDTRSSFANWRPATTIDATLTHPCSSLGPHLNFFIRATAEGTGSDATSRLLPTRFIGHGGGRATMAAEVGPLHSGRWTFQLVAAGDGRERAIGKPSTITITTTAGEWLWTHAPWLLLGLAGLQVAMSGLLVTAGRWRPAPLRVLFSRWATVLLWPSFVVSHSFLLQCWVLSSWFRRERETARAAGPVTETPLRGPDAREAKTTDLVARLGTTRKLWVQGRSGMGKSTALLAWRKAFVEEAKTLSRAAKRYGFVLLPIAEPVMGATAAEEDAEGAIVGLAAASLAQSGIHSDGAWLRRMMRSGRLALAFDSPSSIVHDAIAAFARRNPNARIMIASERVGPAEFELWQLPTTVEREQVETLLRLWLGTFSGSQLTVQLARHDVLPQFATLYDARLAADMITADPAQTVPSDRIALYRAPFSRAAVHDFNLLNLGTLRSVAWRMVLEGRSVLSEDEIGPLSETSRAILMADESRILRKTERGYRFDHDQLRFFLAAEHLVESNERMSALIAGLESSPVWSCARHDQEELWRFLAAMLASDDITALWRFSLERPERAFLQCALHKRGLETNVFPIGLGTALTGRNEAGSASRLRAEV